MEFGDKKEIRGKSISSMYRAVHNFSLYIREMNKYLHSVTFLVKSNEITVITNAI